MAKTPAKKTAAKKAPAKKAPAKKAAAKKTKKAEEVGDDLTKISGIGPVFSEALVKLG